jgi:hypothetical protein
VVPTPLIERNTYRLLTKARTAFIHPACVAAGHDEDPNEEIEDEYPEKTARNRESFKNFSPRWPMTIFRYQRDAGSAKKGLSEGRK